MMPSNHFILTLGLLAGEAAYAGSSPRKPVGLSAARSSGAGVSMLSGFAWQITLLPVDDGGLLRVGEGGVHDH